MLCQACHRLTRGIVLCPSCRRGLKPSPERILGGGVRVIAAFEHIGPARVLAHHLKYRGLVDYAELVAEMLAPRLPTAPLVPIPRALTRRFRYGIDPARALAKPLARRLGVVILPILSASIHTPRRAGGDHRRPVGRPGLVKRPLERVTLVDDVLTTGATLETAISIVGRDRVRAAVVANAVPEPTGVRRRDSRVGPRESKQTRI